VFTLQLDYTANEVQVTVEIETSPPEMKNPTGFTPSKPEDLDTFKGHVHKQFELPASLLE
jgi:D-aminoacyl-tRNA deacylase